jgi:hypothetical protein
VTELAREELDGRVESELDEDCVGAGIMLALPSSMKVRNVR